ncbi:S16 family serine protease [Ruthenibacterium lactatiformans]|uniref:S16 family serine protease n=1 Tax=Ruthenibacterium lactatiformans TaxID=1550024 RepID=UPI00210B30DB|nr:S16 family serine protease [Ruthenibacterium lactatiformans]MCQ5088115.1 hypothetical protein [Ruthenibacterium lactatiformans]
MNKTAIKNFAIWARNKLIADVSYDARLIGITEDGIAKPLPQSFGGTQFFDIGTAEPYSISGEAVRQRDKLIEVIQQKEKDTDYKTAYQYVIEEVAYTWFNRLIAIRFMEVNDYLPSHIRVLSSESGKLEPDLVTTPFDAELPFTAEEEAQIFQLKQDNKLDEVFRILFLKQCNALNEILPALFEKTKNYTELLLSLSVIDQDGVVYHLIHDIPEDDFNIERGGQVEIIGWLYQYYNTEPKAAAFAKNGKITKEEIPAVTQLFTPDWIVRYMVENSLGRLWVEGHPDCGLKENWKYYLEEAQQEPEVQAKLAEIRKEYAALNPEDIKLIWELVGCMFGRYSLDVEGLAYAGGEWDSSKYQSYIPDEDNVIPITDEEYLDDDIVSRLCAWLKAVYGADTLEENLDYIAKALGNKGSTSREIIRNYFLKESTNTAFNFLKANGNRISGSISTTMRDYIINYQDLQGIGMTGKLALPTLIALCSIALGRPTVSTLAVLGEISISGTILKVDELANSLQVCLDSGAKKVLLPITSAADLGTVPPELVGSFNLIFYSSAEDAVFKALGVE